MKKKFIIVLCGAIAFAVGIFIANENTVNLGFDEDTKIIYSTDEGITVMNYTISYDTLEEYYESAKQYIPEQTMTCCI